MATPTKIDPAEVAFGLYGTAEHPCTITVSPHGKLVTVVHDDGSVTQDGSERYGVNYKEFDVLKGRLLTLCDAAFTDPQQRKAFKDMVREQLRVWIELVMHEAQWDAGKRDYSGLVGGVADAILKDREGAPATT